MSQAQMPGYRPGECFVGAARKASRRLTQFYDDALEPQAFPDSPNRRHFTDCVLWPEDEYQHVSEFRFA